jgi:transmembrane sensor
VTYHTGAGERRTITLASGARLLLSPTTTVDISSNAKSGTNVTVTGQVLFTVPHRVSTPFSVRTPHATVRVLGTTFLVRRYPAEPTTRVSVVEGRVGVHASGVAAGKATAIRTTVLDAGSAVAVSDSGIAIASEVAVDGRIVFRNATLASVAEELGRVYGANVRVADSVAARTQVTWTVWTKQNTLAELLADLPLLANVHVTRKGAAAIIVTGRRAAERTAPSRYPSTQESEHGR